MLIFHNRLETLASECISTYGGQGTLCCCPLSVGMLPWSILNVPIWWVHPQSIRNLAHSNTNCKREDTPERLPYCLPATTAAAVPSMATISAGFGWLHNLLN